jgi:hypothetical protein
MGIYTVYEQEWIDKQIESKLRLITNVILENVSDVRSVFLTGGFGRGEGSIEVTQDRKILCLRDFDIAVITDNVTKRSTQLKLRDTIHESLGLLPAKDKFFARASKFVVDIKFLTEKDLIYRDIWFYDLKVASHILYGEDVRHLIPWNSKDVPLSSGLRLLFEKICGLIGVFPSAYLEGGEIPEQKKKLLLLECYKTFVEICTALCILANEHQPKYADRADVLKKIYRSRFSGLAEILPNLPQKVKACTNFKLKPDFADVRENPFALWFETRRYLGSTLVFYLEKAFNIKLSDLGDLPSYMKKISRFYYTHFIQDKLQFSNELLLDFASYVYQAISNMEYMYIILTSTGSLCLRSLIQLFISPSLKFFPAGVLLLFSLNRDGTVKGSYVEKASDLLDHCIPQNLSVSPSSQWNLMRERFLKAYDLCQGFHLVK